MVLLNRGVCHKYLDKLVAITFGKEARIGFRWMRTRKLNIVEENLLCSNDRLGYQDKCFSVTPEAFKQF